MVDRYIPARGDIVWLNFNSQTGREQQGQRPALVISPREYNEKVGLALFCPITSKVKKYPFEVKIRGRKIRGVVLADQLKSLDWRSRGAKLAAKAADRELAEVISKLSALIFV